MLNNYIKTFVHLLKLLTNTLLHYIINVFRLSFVRYGYLVNVFRLSFVCYGYLINVFRLSFVCDGYLINVFRLSFLCYGIYVFFRYGYLINVFCSLGNDFGVCFFFDIMNPEEIIYEFSASLISFNPKFELLETF